LNPFEHPWDELDLNVLNVDFSKRRIPKETHLNLINGMLRRITTCIAHNGWPTRY